MINQSSDATLARGGAAYGLSFLEADGDCRSADELKEPSICLRVCSYRIRAYSWIGSLLDICSVMLDEKDEFEDAEPLVKVEAPEEVMAEDIMILCTLLSCLVDEGCNGYLFTASFLIDSGEWRFLGYI